MKKVLRLIVLMSVGAVQSSDSLDDTIQNNAQIQSVNENNSSNDADSLAAASSKREEANKTLNNFILYFQNTIKWSVDHGKIPAGTQKGLSFNSRIIGYNNCYQHLISKVNEAFAAIAQMINYKGNNENDKNMLVDTAYYAIKSINFELPNENKDEFRWISESSPFNRISQERVFEGTSYKNIKCLKVSLANFVYNYAL